MPIRYKAEYFEFPKQMALPVHKELPEGFEERWSFGTKTAWNKLRDDDGKVLELKILSFCHHCGGWVEGEAREHWVNTLDGSRLCGRRGHEYYCPRCAKEIHFSGMMS